MVEGGDWNWCGDDPGTPSWRQQTHTCPGHGHGTAPVCLKNAEHEKLSQGLRSEYHRYNKTVRQITLDLVHHPMKGIAGAPESKGKAQELEHI